MRFLIENEKKNIIKAFTGLKSAEDFVAENPGTVIRVFNNKLTKSQERFFSKSQRKRFKVQKGTV